LIDFLEKQERAWEMGVLVEFIDSRGRRREQSFVVRASGSQHIVEWIPDGATNTLFG
jgi:hypothetical protein